MAVYKDTFFCKSLRHALGPTALGAGGLGVVGATLARADWARTCLQDLQPPPPLHAAIFAISPPSPRSPPPAAKRYCTCPPRRPA